MKVIVGMGNPGPEYERTRHNVGWWVLDHLADVWRFEGWKKDGESRVAMGSVAGQRVRLVKPQTYMNLSGAALRPYLRREGFDKSRDLLIVIDEVALPVGTIRIRPRGSAGGHNGLKSIEAAVGSQDYARLRLGVGPEDPTRARGDLADYVLSDFGKRDEKLVRETFDDVTQVVETWLTDGAEVAMRLNKKRMS
ncbi:MAG TPA: aminoacyl-tRNA hydrolase [Gemmatimonadaceae bacterium]|nr:aminoacyl-tRNA hydrolase [Gemmatimonadaceae bacterium]